MLYCALLLQPVVHRCTLTSVRNPWTAVSKPTGRQPQAASKASKGATPAPPPHPPASSQQSMPLEPVPVSSQVGPAAAEAGATNGLGQGLCQRLINCHQDLSCLPVSVLYALLRVLARQPFGPSGPTVPPMIALEGCPRPTTGPTAVSTPPPEGPPPPGCRCPLAHRLRHATAHCSAAAGTPPPAGPPPPVRPGPPAHSHWHALARWAITTGRHAQTFRCAWAV